MGSQKLVPNRYWGSYLPFPSTSDLATAPPTGAAVHRRAFGLLLATAVFATPATARTTPTSQADLVRHLIASVVNITTRVASTEPPAPAAAAANVRRANSGLAVSVSAGSGFVIDKSGLIATNWHVLADAFEIVVTFADGTRLPAKVVGAWRLVDLALLKVDAGRPLRAVRWGNSNKVQIGEPVLAMGNAFGVGLSVSAGIVSALNRNIGDSLVDNFIQTDAAINHGNSGGPLFNLQGEVIGVNSAIISPTLANAGLGFAIPSNDARFVFQRMLNAPGTERPGWLGAKLQELTPDMAEAMAERTLRGSLVAWVLPEEPAQKAGMRAGDVILAMDGQTYPDERALLRDITGRKPDSKVTFAIWRDGHKLDLNVTLEAWPKTIWEKNEPTPPPAIDPTVPADLGLTVAQLTPELRVQNQIAADAGGVLITAVAPGCDAALKGVVAGDVVLRVGRHHVQTPEEMRQAIEQARVEGRQYALFMVLPKTQPVDVSQFPGPNWIALRIAQ
jgi:serine protease Do